MRKIFVLLIIPLLCFGWFNWFASYPTIDAVQADPIKVFPGEVLKNYVSFEDDYGVEKAVAYFGHENGSDKVDMVLVAGDNKKGTYSANWVVRDTLDQVWYKTRVELTNIKGKKIITYIDWQDPTPPPQYHHLDQLLPGEVAIDHATDYGGASYIFKRNVSVGVSSKFIQVFAEDGTGIYSNSSDYAIIGESTEHNGILGKTLSSTTGNSGIYGFSSLGATYGVYGKSISSTNNATGVYGSATSTTGTTYGVYGLSVSNIGKGVYGSATSTTGATRGVYGESASSAGTAVYASATSSSGVTYGVIAKTSSSDGLAAYFIGGRGVYTECPSGFTAVYTTGTSADNERQLGCIQTDYAETNQNWFTASDYCFDNYGGRLPSVSEIHNAFENFGLNNEAEWHWTDDMTRKFTDGSTWAITYRGSSTIDVVGISSTGPITRCWVET